MPTDFEIALTELSSLYERLDPEQRRLLLQNLAFVRAATERDQAIAANPKDSVRAAQNEIAQPAPRTLSDADLQTFKAFLKAKPWTKVIGKSSSEFIRTDCAYWLEQNLALADIRIAQSNLARAYIAEVGRHPSRQISSLYVQPYKLPAEAPYRVQFHKHVANLNEEQLAKRRAGDAKRQAKYAAKLAAAKATP